MKDCVLAVVLRDDVLPVNDLQLGSLLKRVLLKAEQEQDTAQGLQTDRQTDEQSTRNTTTTDSIHRPHTLLEYRTLRRVCYVATPLSV